MILIPDKLVKQVDYLMGQALGGRHWLFEEDCVRRAALLDLSPSQCSELEPMVEELFVQPTLRAKRKYIAALPPDRRIAIARVYLNIVENIAHNSGVLH